MTLVFQKGHQINLGKKLSEETKERIRLSLLGNQRAKGNKFSEETRQKLRISRAGQGNAFYGQQHTEETKQKIGLASIGRKHYYGTEHPGWKGDDVGTDGLHAYVRKYLPQSELCQFCNVRKSYDLANITGNYKRDFYNWKYLCRSCHKKFDLMVKRSRSKI